MNEARREKITSLFEVVSSLERKWANEWNSHNTMGLSKTHIFILDILESEGPMRPSSLAEKLHVTTGGVTVLTTKLMKAGYINKTQNPTDRRASQLEITDAGHELLEAAHEHINSIVDRMFGMLTEDEIQSLKIIFSKCLLG
ncbi:MarR family winged helix-turn-helix transcriptional regulator [Rummeliibacillus sp. POC4]|uniref:MarR family winged helix-turn-helix transcriptional regulator n=1 Tax=Rummeliibacillus sp. POC4 TaxID=2305899 RepID=UPI000E67618F|nr:MarR family transcriptional regulator [Rummeliibacillus sp. POC4]RIJ69622.1 MarR family transcriptional regulator [Rummeliibacillus sp. POC4]